MMKPALTIGGIPFYDAPSEVEGSPYWVDLWTDVNGYKIDTFKQGAGLGLSVCKTILEGMDGQITVSSQLGKGSRFTIKIPLKPQEKMNLQNHEQQ